MAQLSAAHVHPSHCLSSQFARGSTTLALIKPHSNANSRVSNSRIHNAAKATLLHTRSPQSSLRRCESRMQHRVKRHEGRIKRAPPIAALANDTPGGDGTGAGSAKVSAVSFISWWKTRQLRRIRCHGCQECFNCCVSHAKLEEGQETVMNSQTYCRVWAECPTSCDGHANVAIGKGAR